MASENAKKAARLLTEKLGRKEKIVLGKILRDSGYSKSTSETPQNVLGTQTFKEAVAPFVNRMERIRDKVLAAMDAKDLSKEQFWSLSNSLRGLTHDIQLIKGKNTESIGINELQNLTDDELRNYTRTGEEGASIERTS